MELFVFFSLALTHALAHSIAQHYFFFVVFILLSKSNTCIKRQKKRFFGLTIDLFDAPWFAQQNYWAANDDECMLKLKKIRSSTFFSFFSLWIIFLCMVWVVKTGSSHHELLLNSLHTSENLPCTIQHFPANHFSAHVPSFSMEIQLWRNPSVSERKWTEAFRRITPLPIFGWQHCANWNRARENLFWTFSVKVWFLLLIPIWILVKKNQNWSGCAFRFSFKSN